MKRRVKLRSIILIYIKFIYLLIIGYVNVIISIFFFILFIHKLLRHTYLIHRQSGAVTVDVIIGLEIDLYMVINILAINIKSK